MRTTALIVVATLAAGCGSDVASTRPMTPNYRDMAALEAALKAVAKDTYDEPASLDYSPGATVKDVSCSVGARMSGGSEAASCTVHFSDGTSFSTPVVVSSSGLSYSVGGGTTEANPTAAST